MDMESQSSTNHSSSCYPHRGPWPWYALIAIGLTLGGIFPWLMLAWTTYKDKEQKKLSLVILSINLLILGLFTWYLAEARIVWWLLDILIYVVNLLWSLAAYFYQKKNIGPGLKRYALNQWRSWISPLLIAVLIGTALALLTMIPKVVNDRMAMGQTFEALARETILWEFFKYSLIGLPIGLLLGLWWAGEQRRFAISHIITFLSAFTLMFLCWAAVSYLLFFVITKGIQTRTAAEWALIPPWTSGFRQYFLLFQDYNPLGFLVVPLLFGSVYRLRDFWKKALLIPLAFFCLLPMLLSDQTFWSMAQERIVYEMTSPDKKTRDFAHHRVEILLQRYPQHLRWPDLAEDLAFYYYQQGDFDKARSFYQAILDRYQASRQWYWSTQYAQAALHSPGFGKPAEIFKLDIPLVDYEQYLTHNWMSLLAMIRFWEGAKVPESQIKIRLRSLSLSNDRILLSPLTNLADLDDAAHNLQYEMLILSAEKNRIENLLKTGIPLILQSYNSFDILFGLDPGRSMICAYSFQELSDRLKAEARKETEVILSLENEGQGQSRQRLDRIAREIYVEYPQNDFNKPSMHFMAPLMAVVYPAKQRALVGQALQAAQADLEKESNGLLTALIGLSCLRAGNPLQAIEWAKKSAASTSDPLPYYVAYLAKLSWDKRADKILAGLPLERSFPELDRIVKYFTEPRNKEFLEQAADAFQKGLEHDRLPWIVIHNYLNLLRIDDPRDREWMIAALNQALKLDPAYDSYWETLADAYDWEHNSDGLVHALQEWISASPLNFNAKLRLAYALILKEEYKEAGVALRQVDPGAVRYNADYDFCRGAVAEQEGHIRQALKHYRRAVENRHYKPLYHLRYGKLLLKKGLKESAKKQLLWAGRIDADGEIKKEAEALLTEFFNK